MCRFELNEDDPNYDNYATGVEQGQPIYYYQNVAEKMRNNEHATMQVDFTHLSSFQFTDP